MMFWVSGKAKQPAGKCAIVRHHYDKNAQALRTENYHAGKLRAPIVSLMTMAPQAAIPASVRSAVFTRDLAMANLLRLNLSGRDLIQPSLNKPRKIVLR